MRRGVLYTTLAFAILLLAVAGWTLQGVRWTLTGSRHALRRGTGRRMPVPARPRTARPRTA